MAVDRTVGLGVVAAGEEDNGEGMAMDILKYNKNSHPWQGGFGLY
jgi:hypothetical protein